MHVTAAFWRLGRSRLKVALVPPPIGDSKELAAFEGAARDEECVLAAAFGAPFFYSQNGYAFAVPTLGGMQLRLSQIPSDMPGEYTVRPATMDDAPTVAAWYDRFTGPLDLWAERTETTPTDKYIIVRRGKSVGYLWLEISDPIRVYELAAGDADGLSAALAFAHAEAEKSGGHSIALHLPPTHPALVLAGYLSAETLPVEAFQVNVLDERAFLLALADEWAARLGAGPLAGFDGRLIIDLYTGRLALLFSDGMLREVLASDPGEAWDLLIPPTAAAQLWLGWRSRAELEAWRPDVRVRKGMQMVVDSLFPKLDGYIYGPPRPEETGA